MSKFAILMVVGPGEQEIARTSDILESLFTYEPETPLLVLVDDSLQTRHLESKFSIPSSCKVVSFLNPRRGRGCGWGAGLTTGVIAGLAWIQKQREYDFVLKVDTDSLIIAPFAQKISAAFEQVPKVGMMGSYSKFPDRPLDPDHDRQHPPAFEKLMRQVTIWRRTHRPYPMVQIAFWGRAGKIRNIILTGLLKGYVLGECCQGGGYAVSKPALDKMAHDGFFTDPLLWINTPCGEDVVVSLYVRAVGLLLADLNDDFEPFGVKFKGLADTPQRLLERGFSIIHSVKDYNNNKEEETRAFFRQARATFKEKSG